ncbi:ANTAR domain-containing protein [Geodermatophilus nigrescens]|uniref:ANTAR domain-containing protein n=1 Tax=Geodermatophilus nigrescens TaxID=1070870 RepID=A0A1M5FBL1_9ACTN|nr:ANTAR domain-containing protein [Geodermatophilus nigrescens]SHF88846.1 ANTAR domain-containing protein [Geodermatophilus nigrescens]
MSERFAVVSTATVQRWARSARRQAQVLREQAVVERARARDRRGGGSRGDADSAATAVLAERLRAADARARNLAQAQRSNRRIGMAIGILMARHGLTEERAFDVLRAASSHRNIRLASIAEEVILTGALDGGPARPRAPGRGRAGRP